MEVKRREHKILDHTILSYFLLAVFVSVFEELLGGLIDRPIAKVIPGYASETTFNGETTTTAMGVGVAIAALLAALIFKLWFKPDFNGCLQKEGLKTGLLMLLPFLIFHYTGSVVSWISLGTGSVFIAFLRSTAPGFGEEIMFRGLGVANYMRKIERKDQIKVIFWLSSIVFGLIHIFNILAGGDPMSVVIQSVYAIGVGMVFCAVYLRTGNLWPTILGHMTVDLFELIRADLSGSGGVMLGMGVGDWITIAAGIFAAYWGLRLINPKYYDDIMEIWAAKWNKKTNADTGASQQTAMPSASITE